MPTKTAKIELEDLLLRPFTSHSEGPMGLTRLYVCKRCQSNFQTGQGKAHPNLKGFGTCRSCLEASPLRVAATGG